MSVLRTCSAVIAPRHSSLSSSQSVSIPLSFNCPITKIILLHNRTTTSTTPNLISTRFQTHLVKMAESSPPAMSPFGSSSVDPAYCEIIVVRHGETAWNVDGRIQGHLDVLLNEVGREQAVAVADRLAKEFKISVVYSSDLKRALETAQAIAKACGGLEVIEDQDLRERHLGDLQGLVYREAAKICPDAHKALASHKPDLEIPVVKLALLGWLRAAVILPPNSLVYSETILHNDGILIYGHGLPSTSGQGLVVEKVLINFTNAAQLYCKELVGNIKLQSEFMYFFDSIAGQRVVVVSHGGVIRALYKRACPDNKSGGKVLNTSVSIFQLSDAKRWILKTWGDVSHLGQTGVLETGFGGDRTSG
ncbi:hypothetical protein Pint_28103 [Pistacia integerrima]|uniref:Uncharacterized protein n=1 Tax=Pistacia integerrima TaxID=434235 RepID=A0ACC0YS90_9ROSI|nr:hypothetical protein Pint_28103 [Pistacia integerrima]